MRMSGNVNRRLRQLVREAVDDRFDVPFDDDDIEDYSLSIEELDKFLALTEPMIRFARRHSNPLWNALADVIIDAIIDTPEYIALEKAIEPA